MNERKSLTNALTSEFSPSILSTGKNNRVVMNQIFESLMKQMQDQPAIPDQTAVGALKHPALPDGTGQIINIGI